MGLLYRCVYHHASAWVIGRNISTVTSVKNVVVFDDLHPYYLYIDYSYTMGMDSSDIKTTMRILTNCGPVFFPLYLS
jgi:hypothetical protein